MRIIQGGVVVQEPGKGVGGLTVTAFTRGDDAVRVRVGSVATNADGRFRLEATDADPRVWNLELEGCTHALPHHQAPLESDVRCGGAKSKKLRDLL